MKPTRYLHIRGTLAANMVYTMRPGYESDQPSRVEGDEQYRLLLLDDAERTLIDAAVQLTALACGAARTSAAFRVRGCIPLHPRAVAYELRRLDRRLFRCAIDDAPSIEHLHAQSEKVPGRLRCTWQHAPHQRVTYSIVARMASGRRFTVARRLMHDRHDVDLARIPAQGSGELLLVVNDGVRSTEVHLKTFELEPRPPELHIVAPAAASKWQFGQPISVQGICQDVEGRGFPQDSVVWELDGELLSRGRLLTVIERPAAGKHRLSLTLTQAGRTIATSVDFVVEQPDLHYEEWLRLMHEPELDTIDHHAGAPVMKRPAPSREFDAGPLPPSSAAHTTRESGPDIDTPLAS